MDVSRITLGHVTLRNEQISLRRVLDDALEAATPAISAGKHRLEVDIPDDIPQVEGDPTRLSQIFQNLLDNAAKYTPEGGTITLRTQRRGEFVAISVRDTGIGLASDVHPRIFELFTRVHPADRIKTSGLGIGLALAKKLIELHGGNIEVRSDGPGKGSEFIVTLPALAVVQSPKPVAPLPQRAATDNRQRVLVVDDNRDAAESLGLLLEMENCTVAVAYDGIQALEVLETFKPDVALLDIGMPGMDGYELARRIRARPDGNEVMLIALTGWGQAEDKKRAADFGFDEHLTKPVDPDLLTRMLSQSRVAA